MRVGFLFNHYLTYQVLHGAPFAFELSRMQTDIQVDLLFSTRESCHEAERISAVYPDHQCQFRLLTQTGLSSFIPMGLPSLHRPLVLLANRKLLASYDALIAPEKNYILLKALSGFRNTTFIGLRHGAGDRPVSFNKGKLKFDYLLVPGQSYYERFKDELPEGCCEIAGYPKFEVLDKLQPEIPCLFDNDLPVVLYTPHFHRRQSSWIAMGRDVLEFFANNNKYNLIFAPHARLFKHRMYHNNINIKDFENISNIRIDTGSERSFDMTYTRTADLYLGDVSSQVYEFIYHQQRPCVFLNPNKLDKSQMNFWQLGPVIENIESLENALIMAEGQLDEEFRSKQDFFVNEAFASGNQPPSQRGAEAIGRFLQR